MNEPERQIPEATRRDIFDELVVGNHNWAGRLSEPDFLARLFDLKSLPSTDSRPQYSTAHSDILQHRVNNYDWEDDWVFYDPRFNLLYCEDEVLLNFLCETIHPVVRPDSSEVETLLTLYNKHLRGAGFELIEKTRSACKPVFSARRLDSLSTPALDAIKCHIDGVNDSYIAQQITRMETAISNDPDLAIGTAKELIETVCKTVLNDRGIAYSKDVKLAKLVRLACESLSLTPENIPNSSKASDTIKGILGNLSSFTQNMAELRNAFGTGHGKEMGTKGLQARHARLAVGAASTLVIFLWETHMGQ